MTGPRTTPTGSLTEARASVCAACPVHTGECPLCGTYWFIRGTKRYGVSPVAESTPLATTAWVRGRQVWHLTRFEEMPNVQVESLKAGQ